MCDKCENSFEEFGELDNEKIAGLALAIIGGLIENYTEDGYADPAMYKTVELAEKLSIHYGVPELTDRFTTLKMAVGEVVNKIIKEQNIEVSPEVWVVND
jgi:hypothetical protein